MYFAWKFISTHLMPEEYAELETFTIRAPVPDVREQIRRKVVSRS